MLLAALVLLALLPGCKKDVTPPVVVTVQAEHPEQGPIAEQISADAILAPVAQAAIAPDQEILCRARAAGARRRIVGNA
jgi:hypothetical protein